MFLLGAAPACMHGAIEDIRLDTRPLLQHCGYVVAVLQYLYVGPECTPFIVQLCVPVYDRTPQWRGRFVNADLAVGAWCRVQRIAVDAAVAAAADKDGRPSQDWVDEEGEDEGGNPVRDEVSKKVAVAFDSIFTEANPRLIPVLNHQRVHLQLLKWDKLQQKLEGVEVRRLLPRQCFP